MLRTQRKYFSIGLLLGLSVLGFLFKGLGYLDTWRLWNIPVAWPPFMDVRVISDGADAYRLGVDPMLSNASDSSGRGLNYPRIWQSLYLLGFDKTDAVWFGAVSAVLFTLGVIIATPPLGISGALWMLAAFFSPAVMFCVERGNTDLLMFFLLALALTAPPARVLPVLLLVLAAFVLKLYPLLGLVLLLGRGRRVALPGAAWAVGFALLYLLYNFNDIVTIRNLTLGKTWLSYGRNVLWLKVQEDGLMPGNGLRWLSGGCAFGFLLLGGWAWLKRGKVIAVEEGARLDGFRLGAACYAGTFLMGNNFDYRLIFLLFAIPQLLAWAGDRAGGMAGVSRVALGGIYVSLWSLLLDRLMLGRPAGPWISFLAGEAAHWVVYGALVWLFCRVLPRWIAAAAADDDNGKDWPKNSGNSPGIAAGGNI